MNLKRLAALVIGLGLGSTALWAQWSFGVKGGLNASKMKWEAMDPKFKIGAQVGGFVTYHLNEEWSLQTELLYALQGCMGRITKRFFNDNGKNGASCLFIGSYKRMGKN